jgi:hypothetical protein
MTKDYIEIGALGWTHPGWDNDYYPEDLPEDWRLDYYSHHFQFVLMQPGEWLHAGDDEIGQWLEDVKDSFDFFLALEPDDIDVPAIEQIGRIKNMLSERLRGLVILQYDNKIEASMLRDLSALATVYVDTDANIEEADKIKPCWRMGREISSSPIGFIEEDATKDMRNMRAHIEAFIEQGGTQPLYMVYEGKSPSTRAMQDAQMILQLLT